MPETPQSVADCILGRATPVECLAIQAGFTTQDQMESMVRNGTPRRLITSLATALQRTCLEHAHNTWLHRNKTPDMDTINADARHRASRPKGRRGIVTIDTTDADIQRTTQWEKERQQSLGRKEGWSQWCQGTTT